MGGKQFLTDRGGYWPWRQPDPRRLFPLNTEVLVSNRTSRRLIAQAAAPHQVYRPEHGADPVLATIRRIERALFALGGLITLAWLSAGGWLIYQRLAPVPPVKLEIEVQEGGIPLPGFPAPPPLPAPKVPSRALAV